MNLLLVENPKQKRSSGTDIDSILCDVFQTSIVTVVKADKINRSLEIRLIIRVGPGLIFF